MNPVKTDISPDAKSKYDTGWYLSFALTTLFIVPAFPLFFWLGTHQVADKTRDAYHLGRGYFWGSLCGALAAPLFIMAVALLVFDATPMDLAAELNIGTVREDRRKAREQEEAKFREEAEARVAQESAEVQRVADKRKAAQQLADARMRARLKEIDEAREQRLQDFIKSQTAWEKRQAAESAEELQRIEDQIKLVNADRARNAEMERLKTDETERSRKLSALKDRIKLLNARIADIEMRKRASESTLQRVVEHLKGLNASREALLARTQSTAEIDKEIADWTRLRADSVLKGSQFTIDLDTARNDLLRAQQESSQLVPVDEVKPPGNPFVPPKPDLK